MFFMKLLVILFINKLLTRINVSKYCSNFKSKRFFFLTFRWLCFNSAQALQTNALKILTTSGLTYFEKRTICVFCASISNEVKFNLAHSFSWKYSTLWKFTLYFVYLFLMAWKFVSFEFLINVSLGTFWHPFT